MYYIKFVVQILKVSFIFRLGMLDASSAISGAILIQIKNALYFLKQAHLQCLQVRINDWNSSFYWIFTMHFVIYLKENFIFWYYCKFDKYQLKIMKNLEIYISDMLLFCRNTEFCFLARNFIIPGKYANMH